MNMKQFYNSQYVLPVRAYVKQEYFVLDISLPVIQILSETS